MPFPIYTPFLSIPILLFLYIYSIVGIVVIAIGLHIATKNLLHPIRYLLYPQNQKRLNRALHPIDIPPRSCTTLNLSCFYRKINICSTCTLIR